MHGLALFLLERSKVAMANSENDTIAAISTPVGEGRISIIRISGDDAVKVAQRI